MAGRGSVDRRTVLRGAAVTVGGAALAACGDGGRAATGPSPSAAPPSAGAGGAALAALDDIAVGTAVSATGADGPVLLVRTTETDVVGFSAICPHQGCTVLPAEEALACPCHASKFELSTGAVLQGPATRDLSGYPVSVVDGSVVPA